MKMGVLNERALVKLRADRLNGRLAQGLALARTARALPTLEELEPLVMARLRDLRGTLTADVGLGRLSLGALLGEDRLRVYRDGRIEGTAMLRPETLRAPGRAPEPIDSVVAGAGKALGHLPVPIPLPVSGCVAAA